ncbi:MAG TPA: RpiB/LacA/LacB family sugar-phosphate isomerase [Candidatus Paceibacterota bacterium]|nr:RpiB/LacA/LacB family sugar-phosphate isomerase [Candidatus Paceibacterota bacterium]
MVIYLGSDHRGFKLKETVSGILKGKGYEVVDFGNSAYDEGDDYVDFAKMVAQKVSFNPEVSRGILFCGSGAGMDMTANKFRKVRSVLGVSSDQVYSARHDDDANILSIAAGFIGEEDAKKMIDVFLETPFDGEERHRRRLDKMTQIEQTWS